MSETTFVTWETKAIERAREITETPEWRNFADGLAVYVEDRIREKINEKYIDTELKSQGLCGDHADLDAEYEFGITLEGELSRYFLKYFVKNYLGGIIK